MVAMWRSDGRPSGAERICETDKMIRGKLVGMNYGLYLRAGSKWSVVAIYVQGTISILSGMQKVSINEEIPACFIVADLGR
jgi:hypothetical protein